MAKAIWNGRVIADSDATIVVEGNHYFPPESIDAGFFAESEQHSMCPWKGIASYYDVQVQGELNRAAAWYYPNPKPAASDIKGYIAFWHGIRVVD